MPKLGLTMTDGTIREWLVSEGSKVQPGEPVLIIETDKVETEVEARAGGILQQTAAVGESYECGAVIGWFLEDGEQPVGTPKSPTAPIPSAEVSVPAAETAPAAPAPAPALVGALATADVATRGEGGRILASPRARAAGRQHGVDLAQIAGTGPAGRIVFDDVNTFHAEGLASAGPAPIAQVTTASSDGTSPGFEPPALSSSTVLATGGARMLAELLGIELAGVPTVAPGARITREDVAAWVRVQLGARDASDASAPAAASRPAVPLLQEPSSVIPLRGMRGVIAQRMHGSLGEMAQLTLAIEADMTAINAERDRRGDADSTVPGYTAWVVAASSRALADHPHVNSQITADGVAVLPDIHIGVAVALDEGLIVPVVEHADIRAVDEIHGVVADLASRARAAKLTFSELEGATFSVTALGMYGVDMFTPIVNPPNTAILGVGQLRTETAWEGGQPRPKTVMTLSLTWDHRAFDGAPAAEFAQSIVRYLENPDQLE